MNLLIPAGILSYSQINHPLIPSSSEGEPGLVGNMNIPCFKATRIFMVARKWSHTIHRTSMFTLQLPQKIKHSCRFINLQSSHGSLSDKMGLGEEVEFSKTQVTVNNLELQGATAAPPFHGATVTLAGTSFWKEKKSRKNEDRTFKTGLISARESFVFLLSVSFFRVKKIGQYFLIGVNFYSYVLLRARTNQINSGQLVVLLVEQILTDNQPTKKKQLRWVKWGSKKPPKMSGNNWWLNFLFVL